MEAVPDDFLGTVVFLAVDQVTAVGIQRVPNSTGFWVRIPVEGQSDLSLDYVVTARHCINSNRKHGTIYVRINLVTGRFIEIRTEVSDWYLHDQADVAAIPVLRSALPKGTQPTDLASGSLKIRDFVGPGPEYMFKGDTKFGPMEIQPRVGHQVYFLGLFTQRYGLERNLPIARFGNISRMPELLDLETSEEHSKVVAYLVESHSWGGVSGSPVFFMYPTVLEDALALAPDLNVTTSVNLGWVSGFMGLVSGHYPIIQTATKGDVLGEIQMELNSGIAIVTPAEAVTQLLMRHDLVEQRMQLGRRQPQPGLR